MRKWIRFGRQFVLGCLASATLLSSVPPFEAAAATAEEKAAAAAFADSVIGEQGAAVEPVQMPAGKKAKKKAKKQLVSRKKKALKKLFSYMSSKQFGYTRGDLRSKKPKGWYISYANQMLQTKSGNCYSYAAAFAALAKRATSLPVRVVTGKSDVFSSGHWQPHAWTEVKIAGKWYTFDANAARFSSRKLKWSFLTAAKAKKHYRKQKRYTVKLT